MNLCDAEHPSLIPMDSTTTRQAPRGPMTRARARTVKPEVNSFRFEFHSDSLESRILPHMETLCTRRYQEQDREEARTEALAHEEKKE